MLDLSNNTSYSVPYLTVFRVNTILKTGDISCGAAGFLSKRIGESK